MSTARCQDPANESRDNPVTLEGQWVREATESGAVGLNGSSATPESEEVVVDCPQTISQQVEDTGPEGRPEGERRESVDIEEDSDIEAVAEEVEEEEQEGEQSILADQNAVVDAHHFPMAGFRFMFLDLVHTILNRVYYNNHILVRGPQADQQMDPPNTSESGRSNELQVPPGPVPSTVRAAGYEHQGSDLPEIISTFPELEEPADFEETADRFLQESTARAAEQAIEEMAEAAAVGVAEEETAKEIIEQAMASEGKETRPRVLYEPNGTGQGWGGRK